MQSWDIIVIGSGVGGTAAALAAASRGARVAVVTGRPGASALSSGAWHGAAPRGLLNALHDAGLPIVPAETPLLSPDGVVVHADFAASTHTRPLGDGPVLVCGIDGLPSFHPHALARLWTEVAPRALPRQLRLADTPRAGWNAASLARQLEHDLRPLIEPLRTAVTMARCSAAIIPAVLGLQRSHGVREQLEQAVGCTVVEALGTVPAVPGWRLHTALHSALERGGVTRVEGWVAGRTVRENRVATVQVGMSGNLTTYSANAFVLASGKYVGGGIRADTRLTESVLDVPVWIEHAGERFERVEPIALTNTARLDGQPLLSAGIFCDVEARPVGGDGRRVFDNVWAAGAVRADTAPSLGAAAAQGWAAGERAAA